jgi:antirestriction protein ArdC
MKTEDVKTLAESALDTLATQLDAGRSTALTRYLATMARFHRYSLNNVFLIHAQRPEATRVAGFGMWRKLGRCVRRGEKGIAILLPMTYQRQKVGDAAALSTEPDSARPTLVGFKAGYVFDVSQTHGDSLPTCAEVAGDPGAHTARLKGFVMSCGISISYENAELGSAHGASLGGRILLRDDLSPAVTFSVLVHEVAHELLHKAARRAATSKTVRETEAEAVAFVVSHAIGLDTNTAASDYIQLYSGNRETLLASLEEIRQTAARILAALHAGPS